MKPWKRIEPTVVTKIDYHNVIIKTFELPDGRITTRAIFLAEGRSGASIIAVTRDNKVIIARQFRPGPERVMDDLPGGFLDDGEDAESAARRELLEETGYRAGSMEFLGPYNCGAYSNGTTHYFLALDCESVAEPEGDGDEFIELRLVSIDEFLENAKKNTMTNPVAVLMAYDKLMKLKERVAV